MNMSRRSAMPLVLLMSFLMASCGPKFYYQNDYSFYKKDFVLDEASFLRTDGFYVLESEWPKNNDSVVNPDQYEVYKFYKTGQVNLILIEPLQSKQAHVDLIQNQINDHATRKKASTLFQGYYKIKNKKIIIQQVNVPLRQFYYLYGYLDTNKLILVKKSITGNEEFREDYFTGAYKETYIFVPHNTPDNVMPNW